jgi:hypothetical protein
MRPRSGDDYNSHELATLERSDVGSIQFKPLSILAFQGEPFVPIRLDPLWIVGTDNMNRLGLLRKLDRKLIFAAANRVRPADLVESARFG